MDTESQNKKILSHLLAGKTITPMDALQKYGCFRLSARIFDLEKTTDFIINRSMEYQGRKKFMRYWISND
jgi:hypothetical protein